MSSQIPDHELQSALSHLQRLSDDELKQLLDDDAVFENFIQNLPQIKKWDTDKEMLMTSNKSLAEYNLTFEPKLKEGKAALMELYERARSLGDELETKRAQLESLSSRTSLDTTYALLQAAAAEAEEESDSYAETYLSGDVETEAFVSKFISLRLNSHLRRLKAEKLGEIVTSQRNRSTFSGVPYPTVSPGGMPMPPGMM